MAKLKYDVTDADTSSAEPVPAGIYEAVVEDIILGKSESSSNPMMTVTFAITKGDHKGRKFWYYILVDGSQDWRLREFTDSLGLKTKGELDTDKVKGVVVQLKTVIEAAKDGYDAKGKVKNVMPAVGTSAGDGEGDEEEAPYEEWELSDLKEEIEARELKVEGRQTKAKLVRTLEANDAESDDGEEEEDEEGDEEEDGPDLESMSRAELKAFIKANELEVKVLKSTTDAKLRELITEALPEPEEDEEEEEEDEAEEEEEDGLSAADLEGLDRNALKKYIKDNEIEVRIITKDTVETLKDKIADALGWEADEEEAEEEESDEEVEPYDEWELADLKAELKERGLKIEGRKSVLVKRLEQDDAKDGDPF